MHCIHPIFPWIVQLSMWIHALVNTSFHPSFLINFSHPKKITIETKKEGGGKKNLWLLCHFLIYLLHLYQKTTKCTAFQQLFVRTKKWIWLHVASKTFSGKIPGGNIRQTPLYNGHLELVPAFLHSFCLTLYKMDTSLRWTLSAGPKGVRLRESWLYYHKFGLWLWYVVP